MGSSWPSRSFHSAIRRKCANWSYTGSSRSVLLPGIKGSQALASSLPVSRGRKCHECLGRKKMCPSVCVLKRSEQTNSWSIISQQQDSSSGSLPYPTKSSCPAGLSCNPATSVGLTYVTHSATQSLSQVVALSVDLEGCWSHEFWQKRDGGSSSDGQERSGVQFSSVTQSCLKMDCNMPGLPVHHQLLEFTQTHVHWVSDAIQASHPLSSPSPPALNASQHQSLFKWVSSSHQVAKVLEFQLQHQSLQWTPRTDLL